MADNDNKRLSSISTFTCILSALIGYNVGLTSGPLIHRKELQASEEQSDLLKWILAVLTLSGLIVVGWTPDSIGRRCSIGWAAATFFIGRLLAGFARTNLILLSSRVLTNVGLSYGTMITTIYVAEVSPASSRGKLTSLPEVYFNGGTLFGYLSDYAISKANPDLGWHAMLWLGIFSLFFLAIRVLAMPESPGWLVMQGHLHEAQSVLDMISNSKEEAVHRLIDIKKTAGIPTDGSDNAIEFTNQSLLHPTPSIRHMLACALGMHCFQQASGIDAILKNPHVFEMAGLADAEEKIFTNMIVHTIKTVFTLLSTLLLDKVGRRPLMLSSIGGMFFTLMSLGVCLTIFDHSDTKVKWAGHMSIMSSLLYIMFFSIGVEPITKIYSSEVFPLRLRAQAGAVSIIMDRAVSELFSRIFIWLCKEITFGGAAFSFMVIASFLWVSLYVIMPETKAFTLEENGRLFGKLTQWRKVANEIEMERINRVVDDETMSRPSSRSLPCPSDGNMD